MAMWLMGAVIGLLLGALSSGDSLWFFGALLGGCVGFLLSQKYRFVVQDEMLARLRLLEAEVERLRDELAAHKKAAPVRPVTPVAPPPVSQAAPAAVAEPVAAPDSPRVHVLKPPAQPLPPRPQAAAASAARPAPQVREIPEPTIELPAWLRDLWGANPLAKIGIVLLFFGVASGLKLAVEYGLMPVWLRLLAAAVGGGAMVVFGWSRVQQAKHRVFGQSLQGGGFAVLYLVVYFMLARYAMIGQLSAFVLFAVLGVACVLLAARQDAPLLAVFGIAGAFLAPVLAGGDARTPLPLFSYFALLNVFILAVDWFKSWRVLNLAGFILTLVVGCAWGVERYHERHYLVTQVFVVLFLVAYSAMPALTALWRAPGHAAWQEGMLLFGPPVAGAGLQYALLADTEYGLAWSALLGGLWYLAWWLPLFRRPEPEIRLVERSHLGIAIALLTIAIPLAFGAQVTSAFWAAEGSAVLWFGVRQRRLLAQSFACLMLFVAGVALLWDWDSLSHTRPVFNDVILSAALMALSSLFAARQLRRLGDRPTIPPALPFVWGLLWWFVPGLNEVHHFLPAADHAAAGLAFVAVSVGLLEVLATRWVWPQAWASALLLLPALWLGALMGLDQAGHPLAGWMPVAMALALGVHYSLLRRHEAAGEPLQLLVRHLVVYWLLLFIAGSEFAWLAEQHLAAPDFWQYLGWCLALAAGVAVPVLGAARDVWPFRLTSAYYGSIGVLPPWVALAILLLWANGNLSGQLGHLPYLPLLSVFDISQMLALAAMALWARCLSEQQAIFFKRLLGVLAFVWISAMAARLAHAWGDVAFNWYAMRHDRLFQTLLTLIWTVGSITTMIAASRAQLRGQWYAGFGLLAVVGAKLLLIDARDRGTLMWTATLLGVAVLVLAASYFAPRPPEKAAAQGGKPPE